MVVLVEVGSEGGGHHHHHHHIHHPPLHGRVTGLISHGVDGDCLPRGGVAVPELGPGAGAGRCEQTQVVK